MRKSFLNTLMGRTVVDALELIKDDGHNALVVPFGTREASLDPIPSNTVILWQEPMCIVRMAQAGNPVELEDS